MQFSSDQLLFPYMKDSHLSSTLQLTNTSNQPQQYKLRASTANRFIIKPSQGILRVGQSITIQIAIHRQAVPNISYQKIQVLYGTNYQKSKFIKLALINQRQDRLNLTIMIEKKQQRVKQLEEQMASYKNVKLIKPIQKQQFKIKKLLLYFVVGIVVGFIVPIEIISFQ